MKQSDTGDQLERINPELSRAAGTMLGAVEEIINSVTHGVGALLSFIGLGFMLISNGVYNNQLTLYSVVIYGVAMIVLYLASMLYHGFFKLPRIAEVFRIIDHSAIYVFIAGSYTPFILLLLEGDARITLLSVIWGLAFVGVLHKIFFIHSFRIFTVGVYLAMGWAGVFFIDPLFERLQWGGMVLLVSGGLAYSAGVIFYLFHRIPFMHSVWHLHVIAGSVLHFLTIYYYVIPASGVRSVL